MNFLLRSVFALLIFVSNVQANEDSLLVASLLKQADQSQQEDSSLFYANKALEFASKKNYITGVLLSITKIGNFYAMSGKLEEAISFYKTTIPNYKFDATQLSTAYNQIGIYHVYLGHYDSTETYFLKALEMRKQMNDSVGIGASLNNLGNVMMSKGDYDKAVKYFFQSLKIRETIKDSAGIASSTNNIGMIYYKQQKFKEAIKYYHKALEINIKHHVVDKEIFILNNLGNIYDEMNELDSSVHYYSIAINKADEFGQNRLIAISYGNMGVTQEKLGNYNEAIKYLNKALQIRTESNDLEGQAILYNNLGSVYISLNKNDSAVYFFKKSNDFTTLIGFNEATRDNYLGLATAYDKLGKYKEAFEAHKNYLVYKDSIFNEESNKQIEEIRTQYETEKKEKQLAEQEVIITKEQLRVRQRNYTLVGLALVLIFIVILSVYVYKQQKFKQQKLIEENRLKDEIAKITLQNELHEERIRISRDLHDNIGSQLTFIISSVDNMGYLFKTADEKLREKLHGIADFSRTTITQLRDTIWALNKDEISFEDLKSRLYNYIETAKIVKENITFNFEVDVKQKISFNAIEGVNIYRIVQEAINNSLKYSAATTINVLLKEEQDKLILKIEDDGIGFNINEVKLGNGLDNMKNRATSIKANFNIDSTPEKGTTILLEMPIK
ncbi:MAG: tetratricopeptide repeat protein [Flavobacteriales bacterium]|nr:tetratricopeptide repeat protein [Flavobacteriales bacterium]